MTLPTISPNAEAVEAIAALAAQAVAPTQAAPGLYVLPDGRTVDVRDQITEDLPFPRRPKHGAYKVTDVPSFLGYLTKHAVPETEIWADVKAGTITAVIDAHGPAGGPAGWEGHTATLRLEPTRDWSAWTSLDGAMRGQVAFAEFIEEHLPNFVNPDGATMLELAQTFQAKTAVDFESSQRLKSGETTIVYVENTTATAGRKGSLTIPDTFDLGLQVFEGGPAYKVTARFRYRITRDKELQLGFRLNRADDVLRDAFGAVVADVQKGSANPIWNR